MKKLFLLVVCVLLGNALANAQTKKTLTVKEYFLAIPAKYMKAEAAKRKAWIQSESAEDGNLSYEIPATELGGEEGDGKAFGSVQVFEKDKGGAIIGLTTNLCEQGICIGQALFLDYDGGKWNDVTEDLAPQIDNDEVIAVLKDAPAYDKPLKAGVEVPLYLNFSGSDKVLQFVAGGENGDGGVVAKAFKWNGATFAEFEYEEGGQ